MLYRWIDGEEGRGWFCSKFNSSPSAPSYRFIIAGTIFLYRVDVPFVETTLSSSLFLPPSLREEGETSQTLVASAGEEEEGKVCGKSVRVKAIFRRSFSFHPRKEYHSFLLLAIYSNDHEILAEPFFSIRDTNSELPSFPAIHL